MSPSTLTPSYGLSLDLTYGGSASINYIDLDIYTNISFGGEGIYNPSGLITSFPFYFSSGFGGFIGYPAGSNIDAVLPNGGTYYAIMTIKYFSGPDDIIGAKVFKPLSSINIIEGGGFLLSMTITSPAIYTEPSYLSWQWYYNFAPISGETTTSFQITGSPEGNGFYQLFGSVAGSNFIAGTRQSGFNFFQLPQIQSNILEVTDFCLHPKTLVKTDKGKMYIEQIKEGDYVYDVNGNKTKVEFNIVTSFVKTFTKISKGSLGDNLPENDLLIHGGHPFVHEGKEVLPADLINGTTIVPITLDEATKVYNICTEDRIPVIMEGVPVLTWEKKAWLKLVDDNKYVWNKQ